MAGGDCFACERHTDYKYYCGPHSKKAWTSLSQAGMVDGDQGNKGLCSGCNLGVTKYPATYAKWIGQSCRGQERRDFRVVAVGAELCTNCETRKRARVTGYCRKCQKARDNPDEFAHLRQEVLDAREEEEQVMLAETAVFLPSSTRLPKSLRDEASREATLERITAETAKLTDLDHSELATFAGVISFSKPFDWTAGGTSKYLAFENSVAGLAAAVATLKLLIVFREDGLIPLRHFEGFCDTTGFCGDVLYLWMRRVGRSGVGKRNIVARDGDCEIVHRCRASAARLVELGKEAEAAGPATATAAATDFSQRCIEAANIARGSVISV